MSNREADLDKGLCYLAAGSVDLPAGTLDGLHLCSLDDKTLGTVDGVLIDPAERRLRYFVVRADGWLGRKRYLLSADETTHLEPEEGVLRVDVESRDEWRQRFDPSTVREFSDDDLLAALFRTSAA